MNPEIYRMSACHGKQAFASRSDARAIGDRMQRGRIKKAIDVYRCKWCRAWHVGTASTKRLDKAAARR